MNSEGKRAQPFWSSLSRVELIKKNVPAYAAFEPHEISWEAFRDRWLPGLKKEGILIGVNWSGDRAKGYDIDSDFVREAIEIQLKTNKANKTVVDNRLADPSRNDHFDYNPQRCRGEGFSL